MGDIDGFKNIDGFDKMIDLFIKAKYKELKENGEYGDAATARLILFSDKIAELGNIENIKFTNTQGRQIISLIDQMEMLLDEIMKGE